MMYFQNLGTAPKSTWPSVQQVMGLFPGRKVARVCINHLPTCTAKVKAVPFFPFWAYMFCYKVTFTFLK
jgi:hypothetical protein